MLLSESRTKNNTQRNYLSNAMRETTNEWNDNDETFAWLYLAPTEAQVHKQIPRKLLSVNNFPGLASFRPEAKWSVNFPQGYEPSARFLRSAHKIRLRTNLILSSYPRPTQFRRLLVRLQKWMKHFTIFTIQLHSFCNSELTSFRPPLPPPPGGTPHQSSLMKRP